MHVWISGILRNFLKFNFSSLYWKNHSIKICYIKNLFNISSMKICEDFGKKLLYLKSIISRGSIYMYWNLVIACCSWEGLSERIEWWAEMHTANYGWHLPEWADKWYRAITTAHAVFTARSQVSGHENSSLSYKYRNLSEKCDGYYSFLRCKFCCLLDQLHFILFFYIYVCVLNEGLCKA